jgi:hypothetical protein
MKRWVGYVLVAGLLAVLASSPVVGQAVARLFGSNATTGAAEPIRATSGALHVVIDGSAAAITAGSGTGVSVGETGDVRTLVYKVTVSAPQFIANAVTADWTIATLPAKTRLLAAYADVTTSFACTATCTTATLSVTVGTAAGGNQVLASFDADAAAALFGDADAEMGTGLTRAAAIQGGLLSWAGTIVTMRLTSGTGAIGTGTATNLSQGTITFYLVTETMP